MIGLRIGTLAAAGAAIVMLALGGSGAKGASSLRLHTTLEGDARPFLCKDLDSTTLVVAVLGRALEAKADGDSAKATRLFELGAKLESEICQRPPAEDIVILRCNLGNKTFGDSTISLVKVSALLRSNSSAGEQPFYAWTYANIEGNDESSAREADKRWCADDTVADAPLEPTPDLVQRVQQRFFDFGFNIREADGRLTPETVQALINFQKWSGLPPTGQLTKLTVQKIDATEAPTPWVALAFDGSGRYSLANAPTRRGAEADAVANFRRKSRNDYNMASISYPNCIAFATTRYKSRRRSFTQAFSSAGESEAAAKGAVLTYCNREKGGGSCQTRDVLCAAGKDQPPPRYDRESMPLNAPAPGSNDKPSRYDKEAIPSNAMPPQFQGGANRFNPIEMPINAQEPQSSGADEDDDKVPVPPEPDKPPEQVSPPAEKAPNP